MQPFNLSLDTGYEDLENRDWLVTNGIGGYASGTIAGVLSRSYHGWLVSALAPPLGRTVQWVKAVERVRVARSWRTLSLDRIGPEEGWVPANGVPPTRFWLEGTTPVWEYALGAHRLQRRIWMHPGENTTWVAWELVSGDGELPLEVTLYVQHRDFHSLLPDDRREFQVAPLIEGVTIQASGGPPVHYRSLELNYVGGQAAWRRGLFHRVEAYRGLEPWGASLQVGRFTGRLLRGRPVHLAGSAQEDFSLDGAEAYRLRKARDKKVLRIANLDKGDERVRRLVLAADQFIVRRSVPGESGEGHSVIAGYHWFGDWGRDTMIALPGLTLSTGRADIARSILRTFAKFVDRGMLPNRFPDDLQAPEYNTVDATLWYFEALRAYTETTGDRALIEELFPVLVGIIDWHIRGTRYGIQVDPSDGLLAAGEPGVQLTWMDAKVGDWVVTPRTGKAVEINALWYSALRSTASFAEMLGRPEGAYSGLADRVQASFDRFWNPARGFCFDVIDSPGGGSDPALRPNQVIAASLLHCPLTHKRKKAIVEVCGKHLLTPYGLRSLAPDEPGYQGTYGGDQRSRDGAYHQGTVWGWLIGPYVSAHYRVYHDAPAARAILERVLDQLGHHGVGTLSEIYDGDPPHTPRGCIAQAWSVAEVLRCWDILSGAHPAATGPQ